MKAEIEVLQPGLFSTIQDTGRYGYLKFGVPISGPMDSYSAKMVNLILQNPLDCAVLEITQMGPKLKFSDAVEIVISGADLSPWINEIEVKNNVIHNMHPGDILSFGKRKSGCRSYLGIKGGFQTETVLNSRSWYEGITSNYRLNKGMKLQYHSEISEMKNTNSVIKPKSDFINSKQIFVFAGPEFEKLPEALQKDIFVRDFKISRNNNRMAVQLEEKFINAMEPIITGPVVQGTVQLTPAGKLIILMKDCQTTGGYPRVLQVLENGMNSLSQKVTGETIQFCLKKDDPAGK